MDWDKLRGFHTVAEHRNMAHAGEQLGLSPSAVSRQISALERDLGCRLFHRHARGLSLTEQGQLLYDTVHEMMGKLALVEARVGESRDEPKGLLRITTAVSLGGDWIAPRLARFLDRYPEIRVLLSLEGGLSVAAGEADLGIFYERPTEANVIIRRLMEFEIKAYASPGYLAHHGIPRTAQDLDEHRIIGYEGDLALPGIDWLLRAGREGDRPRRPILTTNNTFAIRRAASTGAGLAPIPTFMAEGRIDLVQVLTDAASPSLEVWAAYPEALRGNRRLEVLLEFFVGEAKRDSGAMR